MDAAGALDGAAAPREELARCLAQLGLSGDLPAQEIRALRDKLAAGTLNLVAVGQFKRGKSSLVNALIGDALLPVGVVPLTSAVTILCFGEHIAIEVVHEDGSRGTTTRERLAEYATERGNPGNEKRVRQIEIALPSRWLRDGVRLVDTPGIGSVYEHNTDAALRFLPGADVVLFVLSVEQPAGRDELRYLREVADHAVKVIVVANKTDLLGAGELAESLAFMRAAVSAALGSEAEIHPVSSRLALQAPSAASGLDALRAALDAFLDRDKDAVLVAAVAGNAARLAAQARLALELERRALAAPIEDLERRLERFAERKRELQAAKDEHVVLLEGEQRRLLRDRVEPDLRAFEEALARDIARHVEREFEASRALPSPRLQEALRAAAVGEVRRRYDRWRAEEDARVADAFDEAGRRIAGRLESQVDELLRFAAGLFSLSHDGVRAEPLWTAESGFRYKFWDAPPSLALMANAATLALPRWIGDRILLRHARASAVDLVRTQAGRVRHDFQQRLERSTRELAVGLSARVERLLAGLEAALRAGAALQREGGERVRSRGEAIDAALRRLQDAGARLAAFSPLRR